jgi:hypothetical protein
VILFLVYLNNRNVLIKKNNLEKDYLARVKNTEVEKLNKYKNYIIGRKLQSVKKILGFKEFAQNTSNFVLIYSGEDCNTCIRKGYKIIKELKKSYSHIGTFIISSNSSIGTDQLVYDYHNYIYDDDKGLVRKEINYLPTPAIFLIDANCVIKNVYFPISYEDSDRVNEFMNFIKIYLKR